MNLGIERRSTARARNRERERDKILQAISAVAPGLADGQKGAGLDMTQLNQVLARLGGTNPGDRIDSTRKQRQQLSGILQALQRVSGGTVVLPAVPVRIPRKTSPFRNTDVANLQPLREFIRQFTLELTRDRLAPDRLPGLIAFSAVVFGGLITRECLNALPGAIGTEAYSFKDLFWIDLWLSGSDGERPVRRWFPDPVSQCLILQWRSLQQEWPNEPIDELVCTLMRELGYETKPASTTLNWLIHASATHLRIELPSVLVDYLASTSKGQSLSPRSWWRLLADYQLVTHPVEEPEETAIGIPQAIVDNHPPQPHGGSDDFAALKALQKAMRNPQGGGSIRPSKAIKAIQALRQGDSTGPMMRHLMDWSLWMITRSGRNRYKPSSVTRYLSAFGRSLVGLAGELDSEAETPETMTDLYEEVLRSITNGKQNFMASIGLRHFHMYLATNRGVPPVEIDGVMTADQDVRANTISELEFDRLLQAIAASELIERTRTMLLVMATLLFRLGLRRSELLWLSVDDLQVDQANKRPLLWIHDHPSSSLKTRSSRRRLALAHLMQMDEINLLIRWWSGRHDELARRSIGRALLFCERGADSERLRDEVPDRIVSLARRVCGDDSVVLHTFRHAFASHKFAEIMHAGFLQAHRKHNSAVEACLPWAIRNTRPDLLKLNFWLDRLPRGATYMLSTHAGHVDPTETLHTYVHHQDYLAHLYLRELVTGFPVRLWAALEGISEAALKVRLSRYRKRYGTTVLPYRHTPAVLLAKADLPLPPGSYAKADISTQLIAHPPIDVFSGMRLDAIYRALSTTTVFMNSTARRLTTGLGPEELKKLRENAVALAQIRTQTRNRSASRSRLLNPLARERRASIDSSRQLDGVAPALPKQKDMLKEARMAFRLATAYRSAERLEQVLALLLRTSRSDPTLSFGSLDELGVGIEVLKMLGIRHDQMRVTVRSLPKDHSRADQWQAQVAKSLRKRKGTQLTPIKSTVPISKTSNPGGRLGLDVITAGRRSSGWRTGAYYAACVLATTLDIPLASRLEVIQSTRRREDVT